MISVRPTNQPPNQTSTQADRQPTPRLGIFICDCGDQVASILDTEVLVEAAGGLPGVVYAGRANYWCSSNGRERLGMTIRTEELDRVLIAGCSLRTHRRLFQEATTEAGLNPDLVGLVNIREGCAWPHQGEPRAATIRAQDQITMEAAHMAALTLRPYVEASITPAALVIGGGPAGMTAALELTDADIEVTLLERANTLGGSALTQAPQIATDLAAAVQDHPHITPYLNSHVTHVDGTVGAYRVDATPHTSSLTDHTSQTTHHGPFGAIIVATGPPDPETADLIRALRLPQDVQGHLPELRVRLRPGSFVERGIFVCGGAHYPCDVSEARFQAYSAASRALRHLRRERVTAHGPVAQVNPEVCNGCGDCFNVCPFAAVTMTERLGGMSLSVIDPMLCTGCGNCISICPVGAVTVPGWTDAQLEAQIRIALAEAQAPAPSTQPIILIFACEWSGYAAAELAGAQKLSYPPNVRMIRLDCSGRLQPGLILKAFELGADGVLILSCAPKLCHHERGNERAAAAFEQVEAITGLLGLPPNRLQLASTPPDDGPAFAKLVTRFVEGITGSRE